MLVPIDFKIQQLANVNNPRSVHGVYPYRGKISPLDAAQILAQMPKGKTLLDPFCGSGTIVYEGLKAGLNAIGTDINPLALDVSRGKILMPPSLEGALSECNYIINQSKKIGGNYSGKESLYYFHENSHNQICNVAMLVDEMSPYIKACFFGAIALTARGCNHYKWTSSSVGKNIEPKRDIDFYSCFLSKVKKHYHPAPDAHKSTIIECDARYLSSRIKPESIDFVFTSPPYFDGLDYTAYYAKIVYQVLGVDLTNVKENLMQYIDSYKKDMAVVLDELYKVCKQGAQIIFVVGDRKVKGETLKGADMFNSISPFKSSLVMERTYTNTSSQVFDTLNKTARKEQVVIWTK